MTPERRAELQASVKAKRQAALVRGGVWPPDAKDAADMRARMLQSGFMFTYTITHEEFLSLYEDDVLRLGVVDGIV